ncbi:sigma-70 family RNA polymerase sigma factor [Halalkalibacter hemicellulosilyticus]|uniref:Positive control factor Xpf n=1 Tax=Halalkalibacter hemicellulosilyticusJCM 9152 TaxID=1236971 RepID=W4QK02_9BACI|nr:sigma-70 family RNA polymerase sigma factor [Halalkalibacter hemicellulosilyticus]GAE32430.1 positive control factor Xpf [Halalkalibacter hemicellulosilyticusJCM 9152]
MSTWVEKMIEEYSEAEKNLKGYRESLNKEESEPVEGWTELEEEFDEKSVVGGMVSDLSYSLQWLKRGRRPGNRRGADRRSVYQRTALLDMDLFPSLQLDEGERSLGDHDKRALVDILWELSNRERQCYILHMCYGMSYAEVSRELGITRSSVQKFVERAKNKINKKIS